jgi:hypothetical protein
MLSKRVVSAQIKPLCANAKFVKDVLAEEDGAVPSGEMPPSLVMWFSQQEREAPGQTGIGLHVSKISFPNNFREAWMSDQWVSGTRPCWTAFKNGDPVWKLS